MSDEIKELIEAQGRAFEEFKEKHLESVREEVKKGTSDVVRREEVDRINDSITGLREELKSATLAAQRKGVSAGGGEHDEAKAEHRDAFKSFIRKGTEDGLEELEAKALNITTSADGGYAVPEELDRNILELVQEVSPMRAVASVVMVGSENYRRIVSLHGAASGWVGETASRPETTSPSFAELAPFMGEVYAMPAATQRMIDDAFFDVEGWLGGELAVEFAQAEAGAFISGDGTNKPKGFLSYTINTSTDGARTFGDLEAKSTGVAAGFKATSSTTNAAQDFIDLIHSMKSPLRAGASWMMNTLTEAKIRKITDLDGNFIWRPSIEAGAPASLLGYPVQDAVDMPDVATNTFPVAFGNWGRGYTIVDRMGTRVLRDPYTAKPKVLFYATKRVGGMVADSEAIKLLATRTTAI